MPLSGCRNSLFSLLFALVGYNCVPFSFFKNTEKLYIRGLFFFNRITHNSRGCIHGYLFCVCRFNCGIIVQIPFIHFLSLFQLNIALKFCHSYFIRIVFTASNPPACIWIFFFICVYVIQIIRRYNFFTGFYILIRKSLTVLLDSLFR